ncbi:MAG: type III pantothenate kinase [Alphaproteobacteria bacterium]|nr:type III pantothenate kinase [Alphaproteobacteria bacterium]
MLLAIDSGNSNIVIALYSHQKDELEQKAVWRLQNLTHRTADEYAALLQQFLASKQLGMNDIKGIAISSVVPLVETCLILLAKTYFSDATLKVVGHDNFLPTMTVLIDEPQQLGADRLINGFYGYRLYQSPLIIVDFGTATTFDVINKDGEYCGGVIAPGINLSMQALAQGTAKLPMGQFKKPKNIIGTSTATAMQSGFFYGTIGIVESIITRIQAQMQENIKIIATGGHAPLIAQTCTMIEHVNTNIILDGLVCLYHETNEMNEIK